MEVKRILNNYKKDTSDNPKKLSSQYLKISRIISKRIKHKMKKTEMLIFPLTFSN